MDDQSDAATVLSRDHRAIEALLDDWSLALGGVRQTIESGIFRLRPPLRSSFSRPAKLLARIEQDALREYERLKRRAMCRYLTKACKHDIRSDSCPQSHQCLSKRVKIKSRT